MHGDVKDDCRDQGAVAVVGIGTCCSCCLVWEWAGVHGGILRQDVQPTKLSIARVDVRGLLLPDDDPLKGFFCDQDSLASRQNSPQPAGIYSCSFGGTPCLRDCHSAAFHDEHHA